MRAVLLSLVLATVVVAEDLTPRAGSGWTGFKVGTWIKMKRTSIPTGRAPMVSLYQTRLAKSDATSITLETSAKNALGMEQKTLNKVPRRGEAGVDEKEKVEKLSAEVVIAGGARYECARVRSTVTGREGRRVITKWIAPEPKCWAKRTEIRYDADGKIVFRSTWLLESTGEPRQVGARTVRCLKYKTLTKMAGQEHRGIAWFSRDVPGNTVRVDTEIYRRGEKVAVVREEVLNLGLK